MHAEHNHLVIMAGGSGQRFWPWSRKDSPKQFHDLLGQGKSLLQSTAERFKNVIQSSNVWVVTQTRYAQEVKSQLPWLGEQQILCEPEAKNTASCIAYACHKIAMHNPVANLVITPADHRVKNVTLFTEALHQALVGAEQTGQLVLLGTVCAKPETGYGYIAFEQQKNPIKPVIQFVEKPLLKQAESYLEQCNYAWNTGIFVGNLAAFVKNYQQHLPSIWHAFEAGKQLLYLNKEQSFLEKIYQQLPAISFDHGVLEKADELYVVFREFGWSDLGTWRALYEHLAKDEQDNAIQGKVAALTTKKCLIRGSSDMLIATYGIEDLVIVQHDDVLLICPQAEVQNLKALIKHIEAEQDEQYL